MPRNFGATDENQAVGSSSPRTKPRRGLGARLAERSIAIAVGIAVVAGLGTLALVMSGDEAHNSTMAAYAEQYDQAHAQRETLEGETAPSATDVANVYARIEELAAPLTAFESQIGEYEAAEAVCPGLSAALWYAGDMDGVTVQFTPSYQVVSGSYPCAWFVWDADGNVLAYAFAAFDADSETFSITDANITFYGTQRTGVEVDTDDYVPEEDTATEDTPTEDPALRESDAAQSGVNDPEPEE